MPDYKETTVQGRSWQRCSQVTFRNPLGQAPSAFFDEEVVTLLEGRTLIERPRSSGAAMMGGIQTPFNPQATFPIINPETGEPTGGQMSQQDIYVALFSLYRQKSTERDEAEVAEQERLADEAAEREAAEVARQKQLAAQEAERLAAEEAAANPPANPKPV